MHEIRSGRVHQMMLGPQSDTDSQASTLVPLIIRHLLIGLVTTCIPAVVASRPDSRTCQKVLAHLVGRLMTQDTLRFGGLCRASRNSTQVALKVRSKLLQLRAHYTYPWPPHLAHI